MNEITKTQKQPVVPKTVKGWLTSDYFKQQVALVLPKHLKAERFVRVAITALTRIPKLANCTPESVLRCMMTLSELGLEPDGRRAHLIPFGQDCTLIIDYKGLVELAKNSGDVSNIHAQTVCENDEFSYDTGEVTHRIDFKRDRGAMYAAYSVINFKDGGKHTEVMTKGEIDKIRQRSRAGTKGPWVTDYEEMAKKTVFRRASKWIKLSPEVHDAMEKDADQPGFSSANLVAEVVPLPEALEISNGGASDPEQEVGGESRQPVSEVQRQAPMENQPGEIHTVQQTLAEIVTGSGYTFDQFTKWAEESGNIPDAGSLAGFDEVPSDVCKRLNRSKAGLLKGLESIKAGVV